MPEQTGRVVVINTGGTIAMSMEELTDAVSPGENNPLHNFEHELLRYAMVDMRDLFNLPSPHMTPALMQELSRTIQQALEDTDVIGVVVTHGTDTLEETAFYLDLTVKSEKPVVITGAMRSSNEFGADGPINLIQSVRVAVHKDSRNRGTLVVFNDEIHAARSVTKTHTSNVATFQSPNAGAIGVVTKRDIRFHQPPADRRTYAPAGNPPNVPLIKMVTGMDPAWLSYLLDPSVDGVVMEAFGAGNVPPSVLPTLLALCDKKVPVVMVSRCYNGYVQDIYGYEGGGKQLREMGILFSNRLNGQKARIKLLVLLQTGVSINELQEHFN